MPLAGLDDLVFGGWDIFPDNAYEAATKAGVLTRDHLEPIKAELDADQALAGRLRERLGEEAPRRAT